MAIPRELRAFELTLRPLYIAEQIDFHRSGLSAVKQVRADAVIANVVAWVARRLTCRAYGKAKAEYCPRASSSCPPPRALFPQSTAQGVSPRQFDGKPRPMTKTNGKA